MDTALRVLGILPRIDWAAVVFFCAAWAGYAIFASTTILIIGGLLAVFGAADKAHDIARELPFAARTTELVFDFKLMFLLGVFIYAFFRFTWSMRQYTFGALLI